MFPDMDTQATLEMRLYLVTYLSITYLQGVARVMAHDFLLSIITSQSSFRVAFRVKPHFYRRATVHVCLVESLKPKIYQTAP